MAIRWQGGGGSVASSTPTLRLLYVDSYGADPTGATDSTTAFRAAQADGGANPYQLVLGTGTYRLGTSADLLTFGRRQGMIGQGSHATTLDYRGSSTCVPVYDTTFNSSTSLGGKFGGFSLSGYSAASAATSVGMSWGNLNAGRVRDVTIAGFGTGLSFRNASTSSWSEQATWTSIRLIENTDAVVFDTGSFDYSVYEFLIVALANQNGVTLRNAAALDGVQMDVRGNFRGGVSTNTGYAIGIDPAGGGSGTSHINAALMHVAVEASGTAGQVGHTCIKMAGSASTQFLGSGVLHFASPVIAFQAASITGGGKFGFSGQLSLPGSTLQPGDGLGVQGGSQWSVYAITAYAGMFIYPQYGDFQVWTLPSGAITISGFQGQLGRARRLELLVKQPVSGAAGTVTWPSNVKWASGTAPTLSTANGSADRIRLTFYPSESNWYGELVGKAFA